MKAIQQANTSTKATYNWLRLFFGCLVSGALIVWLLYSVNLTEAMSALRRVTLLPILLSLGILYLSIPLRALQWKWLLGNPVDVPFSASVQAICLGHLGNLVLPLRGGEVVKTALLAKKTPHPFESVLMSVILCRLQDLPPLCIVCLVVSVFLKPAAIVNDLNHMGLTISVSQVQIGMLSFTIMTILSMGALLAVYTFRKRFSKAFEYLFTWLPVSFRVAGNQWITRFLEPIHVIQHPKLFWGAQCLSLLCWLVFALASTPILVTFNIPLTQAVLAALTIAALGTFAQVVPSAPSALGVFHAACLVALSITIPSLNYSEGVAISIIIHLIGNLGIALPGMVLLPFLFKKGSSVQI